MSIKGIRRAVALSALGFLSLTLALTSQSGGSGEGPSKPTRAAVSEPTTQSEHSNIYTVGVRGRALEQLTDNRAEQFAESPSWSRAGRILYDEPECERCASRLFAIDDEGSASERIPSEVGNVVQPASSPDGRMVVVARPGAGIYLIRVRDGSARRLSRGEADEAPAWSPDGRLILFHRRETATNWDICAVRPGGGRVRRLTRDPLQQLHPTWSPDGERIAFTEQRRNGNWVIFSMRPDGSERKQLTDERHSSQEPSWSPDGARIAVIAQAGGHASVAVIDADGGPRRRLTDPSLAASGPAWSPDGKKIAFAAQEMHGGADHH